MSSEHVDSYDCPSCTKSFLSRKSVGGHQATCGKNKAHCPLCERYFTKANIQKHLEAHAKDSPCPWCGKNVFGSRKRFCDRSCSARFNNQGVRRHGNPPQIHCTSCGCKLKSGRTFCSSVCHHQHAFDQRVRKWLSGETDGVIGKDLRTAGYIHRWVKERDGHQCSVCEIKHWQGEPAPLVFDHINGNPLDNEPSNLRFVCGNCDMQLPTYKNKNRGRGRASRRKRYAQGKSY